MCTLESANSRVPGAIIFSQISQCSVRHGYIVFVMIWFSCRWFLSVYVKEMWSRLPELLAAATTVYGSILKIDSTKKICKKLQGVVANSASWCTNVGNEHGEILISVLTESEGLLGLKALADGLVERFMSEGVWIVLKLFLH